MDIICNNIHFQFSGMDASQILNRYHTGKIAGDTMFLEPCESIYLCMKGKITPVEKMNVSQIIASVFHDDLYIYYVYSVLKSKGFIVKRDGNKFYYRRVGENFGIPVILIKEGDVIDFSTLYRDSPAIFITVDEEKSITYFRATPVDPSGNISVHVIKGGIGKLNNVYYTVNQEPAWFGQDFMGTRILNKFESAYILDEIHSDEDLLYRDLVDRNFIVKSGFKYGQNFRIYSESMNDHAEFLVSLMKSDEWYKISRAIRLSVSVRKKTLLAGFIENKLKYLYVERLRDI
jgi:tRNA-intron endonuclease